MSRGRAVAVGVIVLAIIAASCRRRPTDELSPELEPKAEALPPLTISDDTPNLMLTWVDAKGNAQVVSRPADVPAEGREQVRVVVTTKEDGTRDLFYVTNLTVKNPDGSYPVTTTPRAAWDAIIAKRREALLKASEPAASAPDEPGAGPAAPDDPNGAVKRPASAVTVIVYGAAWCNACHEAVAFLKRRKVPVIEKDIEEDPKAAEELQKKLARAGMRGGSIPVIDVKGKILVGFEPHALEAAVVGAGGMLL
jgi:glutaredoxin